MDIPFGIPEPDIQVRGENISSFTVTMYNVCLMNMDSVYIQQQAKKFNAAEVNINVIPTLSMVIFTNKEDSDAFIKALGGE